MKKNFDIINIWPYRSLKRKQLLLILIFISLLIFMLSFVFYKLGAWYVSGFLGIDLVIIFLFFSINFFSKYNYERITITPKKIIVLQKNWFGKDIVKKISTEYITAKLLRYEGQNDKLYLKNNCQSIEIGSVLTRKEKNDLKKFFNNKLKSICVD